MLPVEPDAKEEARPLMVTKVQEPLLGGGGIQ